MVFRSFLAIGLAVLGVLPLGRALAQTCSPGLYVAVTAPRDGEVGVPLNTIVDIRVAGDPIPSTILSELKLIRTGGAEVFVQKDRLAHSAPYIWPVRLTPPLGSLVQGQQYQVVRTTGGVPVVLATFTTDITSDINNPPPPTGATAAVDTFDLHPDGGSDCVRDRIRRVRLTVPDAGKPVVYSIEENGQTLSSDEPSTIGIFDCTTQAQPQQWQGDVSWVIAPGPHTIQLKAVSRSGYASSPVDVSFNANCSSSAAGDGGPGQGGTGTDGSTPVDPIRGCSCQNGVMGALAMSGFALILQGRRKKSREL